ncbi:beta-fructofuranosidase [Klenkia soli]|uniref:beta-fructofuranosidase n=1 Tax=Klenkia soli TaxID=1052260 RepID=A0A1H0MWF4_9ACTN|nr:glycoside hydrolase family 32 protein [Klenkia soli]SDO84743.1 beta-fructofuranosidase [Klenkia soli]
MPDRSFPVVHPRPATGWLNDPNGLAFADGRWHVFFQFHPHSARHAAIHWGHVSSPDLLTWTEEPVALAPRPGELDAFGCWSGVVTDDGGTPTAVYSAVLDPDGRSSVLLARGDAHLRGWTQGTTAVAGMPPGVAHLRDPFLLEVDGHRWALQGAGLEDGRGAVLAWSCDDLEDWTYRGVVLASSDELVPAAVWECPQLVRLGGRWVLVLSLIEEFGRPDPGPVVALLGDLQVGDGLTFVPQTVTTVDTGPAFYAPQVLVRPDRVLLWGWSWEHGRTAADSDAAGWAGVLTLPRELTLDGDVLVSTPARELLGLRGAEVTGDLPDAFEVEGPGPITLALGGRTVVESAGPGRVLVDGSVVEAYRPGAPAHTVRAYPAEGERWTLTAPGATTWTLAVP